MIGIFVNQIGGVPYALAIVMGYKPIETRSRNMLRKCVGHRVAIIQTRRGRSPLVIGYATISSASFQTGAWLDANRELTLIPAGSLYDNQGRGKWCYQMENPEACQPYDLPSNAVRHGRSWCEFQMGAA